jgi:virginiamycin B lyase
MTFADRRHWLGMAVCVPLGAVMLGGATLVWQSMAALAVGPTEYRVLDAQDIPAALAIGPDGAIWFTLESSDALGVLRDGQMRKLSRNGAGGETIEALGLAVDAGGGTWFTDITGQSIGHLAPDGSHDSLRVPGPLAQLGRLAVAPDGAVWFADSWGNNFTRARDGQLTTYPIRETNAAPFGIAIDARGTVWGTLQVANKLVRIDPDDTYTELDVPTRNSTPTDIAVDGAGGVWFTELRSNRIGHFLDGHFDEFDVPAAAAGLTSLAVAPDGSVWFAELRQQKLGRLRNGSFGEWRLPRQDARPFGVGVNRRGDVWYTDLSGWVGKLPAERARADWLDLDMGRIVAWLRG